MPVLTKNQKTQIISDILNDVPDQTVDKVALTKVRDNAIKAALALVVADLPPEIRKLWNDPARKYFLYTRQMSSRPVNGEGRYGEISFMFPTDGAGDSWDTDTYIAAQKIIDEAAHVYYVARNAKQMLYHKLQAGFANITTHKMFAEYFPEFVKYLPPAPDKCANLPATTEIMDSLKAAGFPKKAGQTETAEKKA